MERIHRKVIAGSIILLIAFNIFNALNLIFHLFMARFLSIAEYGMLATLFSFVYILAVFTESIELVLAKYTAAEKDIGKLKNIAKRSLTRALKISSIMFGIYALLSIPLSKFVKIPYPLMILNGLMIFLAFLIPIGRGIMQGKTRFKALGINMVIESSVKLIIALVFVYAGMRVYGAILGNIGGVLASFLLSFVSLKDIFKAKEREARLDNIHGYTKPTFAVILALLAFYSIDIIIAKIVFPEDVAGSYAIASIISKTIFWGTQPISRAMFPLAAEDSKEEKKSGKVFFNALILLTLAITIALVIFFFFSNTLVYIFSGKTVPLAASILFYLGIATSFLSFANLILLYKLSQGNTQGYWYLFFFVLIEISALFFFSDNLRQFSLAFVSASALFLWASLMLMNPREVPSTSST